MKRVFTDLFTSNPYYAKTALHPWDIIEPIGWSSFTHESPQITAKTNRLELFYFPYYSLFKNIYNSKQTDNEAMFEISYSYPKNMCMNGDNYKYLENRQPLIKNQLKRCQWFSYHPDYGDLKILRFLYLLTFTPIEYLLSIDDFTLNNYCYFIQSENLSYEFYLNYLLNKWFFEYKVSGIHLKNPDFSSPNPFWTTLEPRDITDGKAVKYLINHINYSNLKNDPNYKGLHLFVGLSKIREVVKDYGDEEVKFLKYLQYYIYMITGTLAEGQFAIIKIYSNVRFKTNELIFLLRCMFNKITIVKPSLSNLFSNEKYLICQKYRKNIGTRIFNHLDTHYDLLKEKGEYGNLVRKNDILRADFMQAPQDFNNILVNKQLKALYYKVLSNSGAIYVPNFTNLQQKLKNIWFKWPIDEMISFMKKNYVFYGQLISNLKLNPPTVQTEPLYRRDNGLYRDQHRPRGNNSYRPHNSHGWRPHSHDQRKPYYDRRK